MLAACISSQCAPGRLEALDDDGPGAASAAPGPLDVLVVRDRRAAPPGLEAGLPPHAAAALTRLQPRPLLEALDTVDRDVELSADVELGLHHARVVRVD